MNHDTTAMTPSRGKGSWRMRRSTLAPILALSLLVGCGDLFEVNNPTNLTDEELNDKSLLDALGNTAEGELSAEYDDVVIGVALVSDEGFHASTQTDALNLQAGLFEGWNLWYEGIYNSLSAARWTADEVTRRLEELVPDPAGDIRVGRSYFWGAIARITLADLFEAVTFDGGAPLSPAEVYEDAIARLDKAAGIARAAGNANYEAAAYGSIARAYRSLYFERNQDMAAFEQARLAAEKALAARSDFSVAVRYQLPGSENGIYDRYNVGLWDRPDPRYANQIDPVSGERDPRIKHGPLITHAADGREVYLQSKYPDRSADIPASRWQDARLILAEYHLLRGDLPEAVDHINAVRAAAALPPFSGTDPDGIYQQLRYERIVEFWLEARRWQEMRYYGIVPPDWDPEEKKKGVNRRWPISELERASNPNLR